MNVMEVIKTHYINFKDGPRPSDRLTKCRCHGLIHVKGICSDCDRALEGQDLQETFDNSLQMQLVHHQPKGQNK